MFCVEKYASLIDVDRFPQDCKSVNSTYLLSLCVAAFLGSLNTLQKLIKAINFLLVVKNFIKYLFDSSDFQYKTFLN